MSDAATVCWLITTDRPGCLAQSLPSLEASLPPPDHVVVVHDEGHQLGFTGAVAEGWRQVLETGADYCWHHEDDFTYRAPVQLDRMIDVLQRQPHLTQMSLLRQPVNAEEKAAGGIIHAHPEDYAERTQIDTWVETARFLFTTNPSVYSTELCKIGWPDESESEGKFGAYLRAERPDARCGIWGQKWDVPRCTHIGVRTGTGY
jgi:hypothetical protein